MLMLRSVQPLLKSLTNYVSLNSRIQLFYSQKLNTQLQQQKDPNITQQAIVAHAAMDMIQYFYQGRDLRDKRSMRQRILDRQLFEKYLSKIVNPQQSSLKISKENFDEVFKAFEIDQGTLYDKQIWSQDRMLQASHNQKIVIFPARITSLYFKRINKSHGILSGNKGSGKSFSFFIYAYLTQFKVRHQASLSNNTLNPLKKIFKTQNWFNVKHLCYINIKDSLDYHFYFLQLMKQFPYIYPIQEIQKDFSIKPPTFNHKIQQAQVQKERKFTKNQFVKLLTKAKSRAKQLGLITVCAIDQANRIFRLLRILDQQIKQKGPNFNWQSSTQYQAIKFYHQILDILSRRTNQTHFDQLILNSSQSFQLDFTDDTNKILLSDISDKISLLTLLKDKEIFGKPKTIKYSKFIDYFQGQIQLFNIFWFQLLRYFQNNKILGAQICINSYFQKKLKQHRKCFYEEFGLLEKNKNRVNKWKKQVRHLDIRQYFDTLAEQDSVNYFQFEQLLSKQTLSEQQEKSLRGYLRKLKEEIQSLRLKELMIGIKKYVLKGTDNLAKFNRKQYLNQLLQQAKIFQDMMDLKTASKSDQYQYLKNIQAIQKRALVQTIKFGFVENQSLKFSMSPSEIIEVLSYALIDNEYSLIMAKVARDLLIDNKAFNINSELGKFLDIISFPVFKIGNFNIAYKEYQLTSKPNEPSQKPTQVRFKVKESLPFIGVSKLKRQQNMQESAVGPNIVSEGIFHKLAQAADQTINMGEYIAGYPIIYYDIKSKLYVPYKNNALFDNMVLKRIKSETQQKKIKYDIILYDWTMGNPGSKQKKNFQELMKNILRLAMLDGDVDCKLLIVAPDYQVQHLFSQFKRKNKYEDNFFWSEESTEVVRGKKYIWKLSVSIASFNESLPFKSNIFQPHLSLMHSLVSECYNHVKKFRVKTKYQQSAQQ